MITYFQGAPAYGMEMYSMYSMEMTDAMDSKQRGLFFGPSP